MIRFLDFICESIAALNGSLGIARKDMPQIAAPDINHFLKRLKDKHVKIVKTKLIVNQMKPTQKEINLERVKEKLGQPQIKPFIVSKDHYILDGHHQWMAMRMKDAHQYAEVYIINLPMHELLGFAKNYDRTHYKDVNGNIQ